MKYYLLNFVVLSLLCQLAYPQVNKIVLEFENNGQLHSKDFPLLIEDFDHLIFDPIKPQYLLEEDNILRWSILTRRPMVLRGNSVLPYLMTTDCLLEPGDSIRISKRGDSIVFSGKGSKKLQLLHQIRSFTNHRELDSLSRSSKRCISLQDFLTSVRCFEFYYNTRTEWLSKYRPEISSQSYDFFREYYLNEMRFHISRKFIVMQWKSSTSKLTNGDLIRLYDSTIAKYSPSYDKTLYSSKYAPYEIGLYSYGVAADLRSRDFVVDDNDLQRRINRYNYVKSNFYGLSKIRTLTRIVIEDIIQESLEPAAMAVVNDYLSIDEAPTAYKECVKEFLIKQQKFQAGKFAPNFSLTDSNGNSVTLEELRGKVVFLDFWFTGCIGCVYMTESLKKLEPIFENDPKVQFVSISTDKSKTQWKNSIVKEKYTTGDGLNLYTEGKGINHPIIEDYNITSFPTTFLLDTLGKFVNPVPDPRKDNGKALAGLIKKLLPPPVKDGPYVLYGDKEIVVKYIDTVRSKSIPITANIKMEQKQSEILRVATDIVNKSFHVVLKPELKKESAQYEQPSKLLAISDIEGNFYAFRELLEANQVIDRDFNWTFGNGHLVLIGDFFDRGNQVTELLWFIYSLEDKAKQKGGYVHFILGNHEIMNLTGDLRYVHSKYKQNAKLLGEHYTQGLFGQNSELGRWLRTKNVIEKIGDILFVHGGISKEIGDLHLSIDQINDFVTARLNEDTLGFAAKNAELILGSETSPYWYRGYYQEKGISQETIDDILSNFSVNKIVTGHTLVNSGKQITCYYNDKVINTDTHHAEGYSEGLLILQFNQFFRVDNNGRKIPLFKPKQADITYLNI